MSNHGVGFGPVYEDRIGDEPKLAVGLGNFDPDPVALSITDREPRNGFVGGIAAHTGIGRDFRCQGIFGGFWDGPRPAHTIKTAIDQSLSLLLHHHRHNSADHLRLSFS